MPQPTAMKAGIIIGGFVLIALSTPTDVGVGYILGAGIAAATFAFIRAKPTTA